MSRHFARKCYKALRRDRLRLSSLSCRSRARAALERGLLANLKRPLGIQSSEAGQPRSSKPRQLLPSAQTTAAMQKCSLPVAGLRR